LSTHSGGLEGRRVLVVGGRGTLGSRVARDFAHAGAVVVCADRAGSTAPSTAPSNAGEHHIGIDLRDPASIIRSVAEAERLMGGPIEVLVNAAGILTEHSVVDMPDAAWDEAMDINLNGVVRVIRAVLPAMIDARWGRIITVASNLATLGGARMSHYAAAKAGLVGFTRSLAREVSQHNVLANCVSPGPFTSPMLSEWTPEMLDTLPLRRVGTAEEIAPIILLLASEPGGNLFVGQNIAPNSGDVFI
jgi:3-oxoacyl-[acyl-carrier protein] reductase